eukprot:7680819-Lingulodinium_polyedra.AAC.1
MSGIFSNIIPPSAKRQWSRIGQARLVLAIFRHPIGLRSEHQNTIEGQFGVSFTDECQKRA